MTREIEEREPARDVVLAAALRKAYADAPIGAERLDALRRRIAEQARALQAERRDAPAPADVTGVIDSTRLSASARPSSSPAWGRRAWAGPVLLAATLAGVLLVSREVRERSSPIPSPALQAVGFTTPEQALSADLSDAEFARVVTRENDPAALLAIAVEDGVSSPAR